MEDCITVIGHKNPDTDSIASALAYAALKQMLGEEKVVAGRLGTLNEETKFATRYFHIDAPNVIKDARKTLGEIQMDMPLFINPEASCNDALKKVVSTNNKTLYVVNDNQELLGIISVSDLSSLRLKPQNERNELFKNTNLALLAHDLNGRLMVKPPKFKINGIVNIASISTFDYIANVRDSIIILPVNEELAFKAIAAHPSCLIFAHGKELPDKLLQVAKAAEVAVISTELNIMDIASLIYEALPVKTIMTKDVKTYQVNEYVDDVARNIVNTRYRSYPVLDGKKVVGAVSRFHLFKYPRRKLILVDHSSKGQSIDNIDSADILEVIDHHHIGNIETSKPIYYRNQCCGCTCTIIYQMYMEHQLLPEKSIAGMMLSAIISDTLKFKSETTRHEDIEAAQALAEIAGVDLDKYADELLESSVNLKDADVKDLIAKDLKHYDFSKTKVAVGQTNYRNIEDIQLRLKEIQKTMDEEQVKNSYDLMIMMFTHVSGEGTMFVFYGPKSYVMKDIIESVFDEHSGFDPNIISRKQQLIPMLSEKINA